MSKAIHDMTDAEFEAYEKKYLPDDVGSYADPDAPVIVITPAS
jgi:hypothetical protein